MSFSNAGEPARTTLLAVTFIGSLGNRMLLTWIRAPERYSYGVGPDVPWVKTLFINGHDREHARHIKDAHSNLFQQPAFGGVFGFGWRHVSGLKSMQRGLTHYAPAARRQVMPIRSTPLATHEQYYNV
jgi:hypothetical protein